MQRVHRLRVCIEPQLAFCSGHQRDEANAGDGSGLRHAEKVEDGGHDVNGSNRIGDSTVSRKAERRSNHQRHMRDALVDEEAVRALTVIAETLAMVAHHDHNRTIEKA